MLYRYVDAGWIFDHLPFLTSLVASEILLGAVFLALTAGLIAFGVPGVLVPISFTSGALLGGWTGMAVVVAGAMLGSQALFLVTRVWLGAWTRKRWGHRLQRFDEAIGDDLNTPIALTALEEVLGFKKVDRAGKRGDQDASRLGLPPCVDNGAARAADVLGQ